MSDIIQAEITLLETLRCWLSKDHRVILATVMSTSRHTPRPVGAQFALRDDGVFVGSVSGGCAEDDLISTLLVDFPSHPMTISFGGNQKNARAALACGGEITLAIEPVTSCQDFDKILSLITNGQRVSRRYHIETGESHLLDIPLDQTFNLEYPWLSLSYGNRWRLLIIGAVEIAYSLIPIAKMLNYNIGLCDPRPAYRNAWKMDAVTVDSDYPDDWLRKLKVDQYCAVVALTHDPRVDDMGLMQALPSSAFYVGALGSRRSTEKRRHRLSKLDLKTEDIQRLHGPVGIDIGSHSSAEIAVSIMAELIKVRNKMKVNG